MLVMYFVQDSTHAPEETQTLELRMPNAKKNSVYLRVFESEQWNGRLCPTELGSFDELRRR